MNTKKFLSVYTLVEIAMFTAILAILSQISFILPGGIPITLQTFGVALTAGFLGWKKGAITILVYILVGGIGFPVFANFKAGFSVLFGPTGGYLIGFIFLALIVGLGSKRHMYQKYILVIIGLIACHICGLAVYYLVTSTFLPTVPILFAKDAVTACIAVSFASELSKRLNKVSLLHDQVVKQ